jgi:diguanylate cyclase (GGDEF)-like protein/PAS domain S-box-containing protein
MLSRWIKDKLILVEQGNISRIRRAHTLSVFLVIIFGLINLFMLFLLPGSPNPWLTVLVFTPIQLAIIIAHFLLRRNYLIPAASVVLASIWISITCMAIFLHGGISSPAIATYLLVILGAGLFIGPRCAMLTTGFSWAALLSIYLAETQGILPPVLMPITPGRALVMHSLIFIVGVALIITAVQGMQYALRQAQCHEDNLFEKNRQLQDVLAGLEERIVDRTGEILQQKQFYEALVDNSPIAIVTLDKEHRILSCNPAFERLFGYSKEETTSQDLDNLITTPTTWYEASGYTQKVLKGETIKSTAKRRRKDGGLIDVDIYGVPVLVDGQQIGVLGIYHDITERVQAETHLRFLATHDPLTALPNRSLFYEHLDHALAMALRTQAHVAVFFLDLDGFKEVNNLLGHSKGDVLLQQVADRLQTGLRSSDLVARLGGDEFAFVFENIRTTEDACLIAEKILASLARPFTLDGNELCISGSIGISLFPEDGGESKDLLRFADAAMYRVKGQGKHHYQFFSRTSIHDEWKNEVRASSLIQNPIQ